MTGCGRPPPDRVYRRGDGPGGDREGGRASQPEKLTSEPLRLTRRPSGLERDRAVGCLGHWPAERHITGHLTCGARLNARSSSPMRRFNPWIVPLRQPFRDAASRRLGRLLPPAADIPRCTRWSAVGHKRSPCSGFHALRTAIHCAPPDCASGITYPSAGGHRTQSTLSGRDREGLWIRDAVHFFV